MKIISFFFLLASFAASLQARDSANTWVPAPIPRTGQTAVYADGDDGALQEGIPWPMPRFVINVQRLDDNGQGGGKAHNRICDGTEKCDGTVTDRLSGLVWLRFVNCTPGGVNWREAFDLVVDLNEGKAPSNNCGYLGKSSDWRVPNIRELESLVSYEFASPYLSNTEGTGPWTDGDPFTGVPWGAFWTSTSTVGGENAWVIDFDQQLYMWFPKNGSAGAGVWPVRGGYARANPKIKKPWNVRYKNRGKE